MRILKTIVFSGPNRWSGVPVLEAHVEWEGPSDRSPEELSDTVHRLHALAGVSTRSIAPIPSPSSTASTRIAILPFEFEEESLLRECLTTAIHLIAQTPLGTAIDIQPEWRRLADLADDIRLGPSSRAILRAAARRGIPYYRLNQGSLVQFGEGAYQRRTWTAETDATSAIAEAIASDKQLTRSMLDAVGVNVPKGRSVVSRDDAWQAAQEIGVPVAVKPRNANHAVGVSLDLTDREAVLAAYDWACQAGHTTDVLVEQFVRGDHHRLLVVGDRMVAAARGQREYLFGDGVSTIRQLVEELNRDPRRGENYTDQLQVVKLDDAAAIVLGKQGFDFDSVPPANEKVLIVHVGDLIEDCTDAVHPSTQQVAVLAAKTIGLDIAGMDVVATDIARPLTEQRGCIIEVNAGPSLTPHVAPLIGEPRPVGDAVVDLLFSDGAPSKILTLLLLSDQGSSALSQSIADSLGSRGFRVGMASSDSISSDAWPLRRSIRNVRSLLLHPFVTALVIDELVPHVAEQGLSCTHAEWVLLPHPLFLDGSRAAALSPAASTLAAVRHLLQAGGRLIVYGSDTLEKTSLAEYFGIGGERLWVSASSELAAKLVCEQSRAS